MGRKFLIIDDSALMRRVISDIIKENSEYEVLDIACNGLEGLNMILKCPGYYDLILLDINMPKMSGLEMLEELSRRRMKETVVVVSTVAKEGAKEAIRALELGAVDFLTKPTNFFEVKGEGFKDNLLGLIEMACSTDFGRGRVMDLPDVGMESGVHTNISCRETVSKTDFTFPVRVRTFSEAATVKKGSKLVALACSTGGPKSLQQVIPYLPAELDAPVVLVQHMPKGFTASLAARLDSISPIRVHEAQDGQLIEKGHVYIAPGGMHIKVEKNGSKYYIRYEDIPPIDGLKPCANIMYRSLISSDYDEITCVVLTGMGADGTAGIRELKESGHNIHVIGQDEDSCVVYGMPRALAQAGLTDEVVPLNKIAERIIKNVGVS